MNNCLKIKDNIIHNQANEYKVGQGNPQKNKKNVSMKALKQEEPKIPWEDSNSNWLSKKSHPERSDEKDSVNCLTQKSVGLKKELSEYTCSDIPQLLSGDDLFSALKPSQSFSNSNLGHLRHSLDSDRLPVLKTLWSSSYSESFPAIPNTTTCSFHPSTLPDISFEAYSKTSTSSKGNSEISSDSTPSNLNSTPTFSRYSWGCNRDRVAPTASDIKGHVIRVICDIKGWGWSGLMGNAGWWPWSWTSIV